eukprot:CAMPEP_0119037186 /NCGR_PEP_ID=MMETSP1177-20130426/5389_1 /TAXON_ID=2985 /ORGANISM="Ochromonas sp, Strain CCMP1899" /LENGTH=205 /DNA_ID=CAMNT_0006998097 /DNA_START=440 /DNA_END=1057 /DNA_ORIENTATION=-
MVNEIELTSLTNHMGPFYLTKLLLPKLEKTAEEENVEGRVVNVSSRLEKNATPNKTGDYSYIGWLERGPDIYTTFSAYANSKLCNLLMTLEMARRLDGKGCDKGCVTVNAVTPGMVNTELGRFAPYWQLLLSYPLRYFMLKSPDQGASTVIYAATDPSLSGVTGKYFGDSKVIEPSPAALSADLASIIWKESERLIEKILLTTEK